jgi:hypothetical protein
MYKILAVLPLLLLISCGLYSNEKDGPVKAESAFREFQLAINVLDIDTAQKLATENCKKQLQLLGVYMKMSSNEEIEAKKKELFAEIKTIECLGDSNKKTCSLCCTLSGEEKKVILVQQNGKWLVDAHFGMADI